MDREEREVSRLSLKDSLSAAKARVEHMKREMEREENALRECRAALQRMSAAAVQEAAEEVYADLCDRIADALYDGREVAPMFVEGCMELPVRLQLPGEAADMLRKYREAVADLQAMDAEPYLVVDARGCGVRLTQIQREELFWGFRNYLSLTKYGAMLVGEIRRRARDEGIEAAPGALEASDGGEVHFREMADDRCMIGRADADCRLALKYRYGRTKATKEGR